MKQINIKSAGEVIEALGNSNFRIKLNNGHEIIATISGKIRINSITILVGDEVEVEMSPYDLSKGRITKRINSRFNG